MDISHVLALGNQAEVTSEECIEALVEDDSVTAIAMHIEALTDVARFVGAIEGAHEQSIPVVALKTGVSAQGAAIAVSHTSSMVGGDVAYEALFERVGVRRVRSIPELLDTTNVLSKIGPLTGNRMVTISNPLDYHTFIWGDLDKLEACFTAVLDGAVDAAILVLDFPSDGLDASSWWPTLHAFATASTASGTSAIVAASMAENMPPKVREHALKLGLLAMGDIDQALLGLEAAGRIGYPVVAKVVGVAHKIGVGGTFAQIVERTTSALLPLEADEVGALLMGLPIWPLIEGHRGAAGAAVSDLVDIVEKLTEFVTAHPDVLEVELNPVLMGAAGAMVVDALIVRGDIVD